MGVTRQVTQEVVAASVGDVRDRIEIYAGGRLVAELNPDEADLFAQEIRDAVIEAATYAAEEEF